MGLIQAKLTALKTLTSATGQHNELEWKWLSDLNSDTTLTLEGQWLKYLSGLGYTGTVDEMKIASWKDLGYSGTFNELEEQFWNGGGTYINSDFENLISGLSPLAWYRFRDDDFTTIADSSGNGYDMSPVYAAAARDSSSLIRSTHPGGAIFPSVANASFATSGVTYSAGNGVGDALSGSSGVTIIASVRWETDSGQIGKIIGFMEDASLGVDELIGFNINGSLNQLAVEIETDSGSAIRSVATTADSVNKLLVGRWDGETLYYTEVDPNEATEETRSSGAAGGNFVQTYTPGKPLTLGARNTASTSNAFVIDQAALFDYDIGGTEEQSVIDAWLTEAVTA